MFPPGRTAPRSGARTGLRWCAGCSGLPGGGPSQTSGNKLKHTGKLSGELEGRRPQPGRNSWRHG